MTELTLIARARKHANNVAFRTAKTSHTYQQLLDRSAALAAALLGDAAELNEARVALLVVEAVLRLKEPRADGQAAARP